VTAPRNYPNELGTPRLVVDAREPEPGLSLNAAVQHVGPQGQTVTEVVIHCDPTRATKPGEHRAETPDAGTLGTPNGL